MKLRKAINTALLYMLAIPVLGILMGGVYAYPAIEITKGREPFLTACLAAGLSVTVAGLSYVLELPYFLAAGCWFISQFALFAARRFYGSLDRNLERFGIVHAVALLLLWWASLLSAVLQGTRL